MPKGQRVDDPAVLAVYQETGSMKETASQLGLSYWTVLKVKRRHERRCVTCGQPFDWSRYKSCDTCRDKTNGLTKSWQQRQIEKGLCINCNEPALPGHRKCAKHAEQTRVARTRQRAAARARLGEEAYKEQMRSEARRASYGDEGERVWKSANRSCAVCAAPYKRSFLHIHHIDEDKGNCAEENMIVLCKRCHYLVHALLWHPNLPPILAWIKTTYPSLPLA